MPSSPEPLPLTRRRLRVPVLGAFLEGWRRVWRAPALAAGALAASFLLALPLGLVMQRALETHLGSSAEADTAVAGWNAGWATELNAQAQGVGKSFTYEFLGFGGTLAIISGMADRVALDPALAAAAAMSIAIWVFLSGGQIDRLARGRPVGAAHFFGSCGVYFWRFLRLAVVIGAVYWALFRWLHPFLFSRVYHHFTRDMTQEQDGIVLRAALYVAFGLMLAWVNAVADFAKVRAVVEDRRSMLGAIDAALRFMGRRALRVTGLYFLNVLAFAVILRLWLQIAPSASAPAWVALLAAETYLLARVWAKLAFMASEIVFFQGELAHAGYAAAPPIVWPDSPEAEAIYDSAN
jgi:hypothetical protein